MQDELKPYRLFGDALRLSRGPYSYEFVAERPAGQQWRIRDRRDDAIGDAATEEGAQIAVRRLTYDYPRGFEP